MADGAGSMIPGASRRDAPGLLHMFTFFFPIPGAAAIVSSVSAIASPMFGDLAPIVYVCGGILLGIFVIEWVIGLIARIRERNL